MQKKMAPPLVTLLSSEAEIQYVALRNINLIVQRYPEILKREIKVFFCKYNDPIYVKMEKLDIMVKLASEDNVDQVRMHTAGKLSPLFSQDQTVSLRICAGAHGVEGVCTRG